MSSNPKTYSPQLMRANIATEVVDIVFYDTQGKCLITLFDLADRISFIGKASVYIAGPYSWKTRLETSHVCFFPSEHDVYPEAVNAVRALVDIDSKSEIIRTFVSNMLTFSAHPDQIKRALTANVYKNLSDKAINSIAENFHYSRPTANDCFAFDTFIERMQPAINLIQEEIFLSKVLA